MRKRVKCILNIERIKLLKNKGCWKHPPSLSDGLLETVLILTSLQMYEKKFNACDCRRQWLKKMLRVMKWDFFLLVLGFTSVHATTFSQQKVNLDVKNETLLHVLDFIAKNNRVSRFCSLVEDVKNVTNLSMKVEKCRSI